MPETRDRVVEVEREVPARRRFQGATWVVIATIVGGVMVAVAGWYAAKYYYKTSGNADTPIQTVGNANQPSPQGATPTAGAAAPSNQSAPPLPTQYSAGSGKTPQQWIQMPQGDWQLVPVTTQNGLVATSPGTTQEYTNMPAMRYRQYPTDNGAPQWRLGADRPYIPAYVTPDPNQAHESYIADTVQDQYGNKHHVLVAKPLQRLNPELTKALAPAETTAPDSDATNGTTPEAPKTEAGEEDTSPSNGESESKSQPPPPVLPANGTTEGPTA